MYYNHHRIASSTRKIMRRRRRRRTTHMQEGLSNIEGKKRRKKYVCECVWQLDCLNNMFFSFSCIPFGIIAVVAGAFGLRLCVYVFGRRQLSRQKGKSINILIVPSKTKNHYGPARAKIRQHELLTHPHTHTHPDARTVPSARHFFFGSLGGAACVFGEQL